MDRNYPISVLRARRNCFSPIKKIRQSLHFRMMKNFSRIIRLIVDSTAYLDTNYSKKF